MIIIIKKKNKKNKKKKKWRRRKSDRMFTRSVFEPTTLALRRKIVHTKPPSKKQDGQQSEGEKMTHKTNRQGIRRLGEAKTMLFRQ